MIFFRKAKRIHALEVGYLKKDLFESQQFERLASEKLTVWVEKHDDLLIKHKGLVARIRKLHPRMKI